MIVANLATYPARRARLADVVHSIIGQVDRLNVVFNQYDAIPDEFRGVSGLNAVIPDEDTRDTGKFYVDVSHADWVFFIDDDILYPPDYVTTTLRSIELLGVGTALYGYHASVYHRPVRTFGLSARRVRQLLSPDTLLIQSSRRTFRFDSGLSSALYVDQVGSGTAVLQGSNVPSWPDMKSAQRFVDVRLARICRGEGLSAICLQRPENWLVGIPYEETIYRSFTRKPNREIGREILTYALTDPRVGTEVTPHEGRR